MRANRCAPAWRRPKRLELAYLVVEAEAALARVAVLAGDFDEARRLAGRVLAALGRPELLGAIQPSEIYCGVGRCSSTAAIPAPMRPARRPGSISELATGQIDDDELRNSFLHNVPVNVELANRLAAPVSPRRRP